MSDKQLDKMVSNRYAKRLAAYNASKWSLAELKTSELGVWKRAGEFSLDWTKGSLADTGRFVSTAIRGKLHRRNVRAAKVIPSMLKTNIDMFQKERYLFPIVFKHGTGTNGRKGLKRRLKGDIDDGCMRSVALAVNGDRTIKVYFGIPIKK